VMPFITEEIYSNLRTERMPDSVHLCDYPVADESKRDLGLERKMAATQKAVRMGRALRSMHSLRNRQPLKAIHLVTKDSEERKILREMEEIIAEELNVKEVVFRENEEDLVEYRAKPNYRVLGKELGKDMKIAAEKIGALSAPEIQSLLEGASLHLEINGRAIDITQDSVVIQRDEKENLKVLNEDSLTVALDPEITEELRQEGLVRDLVRAVQNKRKTDGFEVTDRVTLYLQAENSVREAVEAFEDYLTSETLATALEWVQREDAETVSLGDHSCAVALEKAD